MTERTIVIARSLRRSNLQQGFIKLTKRALVLLLIFSILLPSIILYSLFIIPKSAEAAWFDETWSYRTSYSVNNTGSAVTNQKVKLDIDTATLYTNSKIQSDCDDSRFTDQNGNLLDYFIDTNEAGCNNASTDYYVILPTINAGRTIIYHYYGNPQATRGRKDDFLPPSSAPTLGVGLKGYWKMDEASGTRSDYAHTNNLTDNNTVTQATGKIGNAGQFTAANAEYLSITDNADLSTGDIDFTMAAWVYADSLSGGNNYDIITQWDDGVNNRAYLLRYDIGVSRFRLIVSQDGTNVAVVQADNFGAVSTGTWYFVVAWHDASANTINIQVNNGSANSNSHTTGIYDSTADFLIGAHNANRIAFWGGRIDGVGFWKKVLTAAERTALYNGGNGVDFDSVLTFSPASTTASSEEKGPGPVAYWSFDDGQGTVAQDKSSNNNDGTISGATWQTEDLCISGKCLYFDGSNDVVTVSNTVAGIQTVSFWVRPQTTSEQFIDLNGSAYIQSSSGTISATGFTSPTIYVNGKVSSTITANSWQYVTVTTGTALSGSAIKIGQISTNYGQGFIDDVKIYNYARTASQIQADYNARGTSKGVSSRTGSGIYIDSGSGAGMTGGWISNGLVGYWKMDEASGNRSDSSGNNNTLTDNNTVTSNPGKFGNAGQFTAANNEYLSITDNSSLSMGDIDFTITAWVYWDTRTSISDIVSKFNISTSMEYYVEYTGTGQTNRILFWVSPDGTLGNGQSVVANSFGAPASNTWYFIVAWHDSVNNTINIQINDGSVDSTSYSSGVSDGTARFDIGDRGDTYYMDGRIEEARVYKRVLSPVERTALYNFAPGPVGYWDFEDGSGSTAADKSGNGNNGTLTIGASGTQTTTSQAWTAGTPGKIGSALNFDGSDDYVDAGSPSVLDNLNTFTISAWIKPNVTTLGYFVTKNGAVNGGGWGFGLGASVCSGNAPFIYKIDNPSTVVCGNATITAGNWYHAVVTYNGSTATVYVNGITGTAGSITFGADASYNLLVGSRSVDIYPFNGQIDDVKVYNYARTQKQIVEDMGGGHPSVIASGARQSLGGGPVAYYKFDEGYGTTANNAGYGGSSLNGTLTNMSSPATSTSGWTQAGKFNKGLVFDGSDDYISLGNPSSLNVTTGLTISLWAKKSGTGYCLVDKGRTSTGAYHTQILSTNFFDFRVTNTPGAVYRLTGTSNVGDGTWHHLVGTYDSINMYIYVDGVQQGSTSISGNIKTSSTNANIGKCDDGYNFNGSIDEVKIYPYALTAEEVKLEYNKGSATVLGALGDGSTSSPYSSSQEYCIPGDSSTCAAPVGRWDFEENQGQTAYDTSGNANNGTLGANSSAGSDDPTWSVGRKAVGAGLSFDGSDDYVNGGNPASLQLNDPFTITLWFKQAGSPVSYPNFVGHGTNGWSFGISTETGNVGKVFISKSSEAPYLNSTTVLSNNTWYHLAVTRSGTTTRIYVNGVLESTDSTTNKTFTFANNLRIGEDSTGGGNINGTIDDVRIYNYARSAAQIAWDYNRGAPVGWWKMDEGQGGTLYDSSGNSNNGTWNGTAGGTQTAAGDINTSGTAWANGKTGKRNYSLNFDGTDDYVSVAYSSSSPLNITGNFALSAWVKRNSSGTSDYFISKGTASTVNYEFKFTSDNLLGFGWYNTTWRGICAQSGCTSPTISITDTDWHHLVGVYDSSTAYIYVDGKLRQSAAVSTNPVSSANETTTIAFSTNGGSDIYHGGQIDDVRIYNYALTGTQVKLLYNDGAVRFGPSTGAP